MNTIEQLRQAPYISLATYRKNGAKVATPVWMAPSGTDATRCYVFSAGQAGKVKRLRHSSRVAIARCDVRGKILGPWHETTATLVTDQASIDDALAALQTKYGWQMWMANIGAKLTGKFHKRAYICVALAPS